MGLEPTTTRLKAGLCDERFCVVRGMLHFVVESGW